MVFLGIWRSRRDCGMVFFFLVFFFLSFARWLIPRPFLSVLCYWRPRRYLPMVFLLCSYCQSTN